MCSSAGSARVMVWTLPLWVALDTDTLQLVRLPDTGPDPTQVPMVSVLPVRRRGISGHGHGDRARGAGGIAVVVGGEVEALPGRVRKDLDQVEAGRRRGRVGVDRHPLVAGHRDLAGDGVAGVDATGDGPGNVGAHGEAVVAAGSRVVAGSVQDGRVVLPHHRVDLAAARAPRSCAPAGNSRPPRWA